MSGETGGGKGAARAGSAGRERAAAGPADPDVPLRADALRNRRKILAAAKETFTARGPHIPMEDIARHAGVGVATLYRRFPDRESLIRAVAHDTFAWVVEESRAAVAEEEGAWDAFVRILRSTRELQLGVQLAVESGLSREVIKNDPVASRFRAELLDVLDHVVRAAQAEGTLRTDVAGGDVAALIALLLSRRLGPAGDVDGPPCDGGDAERRGEREAAQRAADSVSERALVLMLDGLRAREGKASLPGEPLTAGEFMARIASGAEDLERRQSARGRAEGSVAEAEEGRSGGPHAEEGAPRQDRARGEKRPARRRASGGGRASGAGPLRA